jgi:hypothetical protein
MISKELDRSAWNGLGQVAGCCVDDGILDSVIYGELLY